MKKPAAAPQKATAKSGKKTVAKSKAQPGGTTTRHRKPGSLTNDRDQTYSQYLDELFEEWRDYKHFTASFKDKGPDGK